MTHQIFCLGIESSCDESSVAILDNDYRVHHLLTESHLKCLEPYKGVMPEVVSREHVKHLPLIIDKLNHQFFLSKVSFITYTAGPGLAGSLLVGANMAQSLSIILNKPIVPIHHIVGHQLAFLLEKADLNFPCLSLVVSGGHTQLLLLTSPLNYKILGQTRDDAAGEAFDKIAKHIGLGYPGGPVLAHKAAQGNPQAHQFSIPMSSSETLDFSFSGLKTQAIRVWEQGILSLEDFCASLEYTIAQTLALKTKHALKQHNGVKSLLLSGGVACNKKIRSIMQKLADEYKIELHIPDPRFCSDNAAMIAAAGMYKWLHASNDACSKQDLIKPNWFIEDCSLF
jgi:N6-L-threonylcarbamoyladenine synthase